jgi:peroxiredoxin
MMRHRLMGVLLLAALLLAACSGVEGVTQGNFARDFTLQTLDGDKVSLSDYEGQVVLVNFWATWCPPCRAEIPDLEVAYRQHGGEGFTVLGVSVEESAEQVRPFVAAMQMTYPVLLDEKSQVMRQYRVPGLPMSLILDRDGVIQVRHVGYLSADQLADYLADLLP